LGTACLSIMVDTVCVSIPERVSQN
jgi:hypothetical protein